jgi:hypothetical protein
MNSSPEEALFALALTKPAFERGVWLDRECGDDQALRARREALLAAHDATADLFAGAAPAGRQTIKLDLAFSCLPGRSAARPIIERAA